MKFKPAIGSVILGAAASSTMVFGIVIIYGVYRQLREFIINPCQSCRWRDYADDKKCAQKCDIRRKHDFIRRFTIGVSPTN